MLPYIRLLVIAFIVSYIICIISKKILKNDVGFSKMALISLSAAFSIIVFLYFLEVLITKL